MRLSSSPKAPRDWLDVLLAFHPDAPTTKTPSYGSWPASAMFRVPEAADGAPQRCVAAGAALLIHALCCLPLAVGNLRTPPSGLVTCSDASLHGGGLCASAGLTTEGQNLLAQLEAGRPEAFRPAGAVPVKDSPGPRVLAISLFDGVGALMCALARLPCRVMGYASAEIDKDCKRITRRRWPGVIELGNVQSVSLKVVEQLHASIHHHVDLILVGAGSPCQDLSSLLCDGQGLQGKRSRLFYKIPRILELLRKVFTQPVHFFVENVFSMTPTNRRAFSVALGCQPWLLDAKYVTWCRRPRLFWCSWQPSWVPESQVLNHEDYRELVLPDYRGSPTEWLETGSIWNGDRNSWLPTLTRPRKRRQPPKAPAGLELASKDAIQRWTQDNYRLQVYNYEEQVMVTDMNQSLRLPSAEEREALMGFPSGYLTAAVSPKLTSEEKFDLVGQMVGNSFCVTIIMILLDSLLKQYGRCESLNIPNLVAQRGDAPPGWLLHPRFVPRSLDSPDAALLVLNFIRQAERGGTDVRLDLGVPYRMQAWPRSGLNSSLFHWSIVHGYSWQRPAHINVLELQAVLNGLEWRLRKSQAPQRILHLLDSQVVCAVLAKGRTSSFRLRRGVGQINALLLASGTVLVLGYVATDCNPSDIPSRWAETPSRKLRSFKGSTPGRGTH